VVYKKKALNFQYLEIHQAVRNSQNSFVGNISVKLEISHS